MPKEIISSVREYCNNNPGFSQVISGVIYVFLTIFLSALIRISGDGLFLIGFVILCIVIGIWIFYKDHLVRYLKPIIISGLIISLLIITWSIIHFLYNRGESTLPPAIFSLTNGFSLIFEDSFIGGNLSEDTKFHWNDKDNQFTNYNSGGVILKTNAALSQTYPLFQNLKFLNRDYILLTKFYLPDGARVGIQFMNTKNFESDLYLGFHFQECRISSYAGSYGKDIYTKGYGDYLYERGPINGPWQKNEISAGNYFILVSVSGTKFSCYFQKENDLNYTTIVRDKELRYTNLGGPTLSRMIQGASFDPRILNFQLYLRN